MEGSVYFNFQWRLESPLMYKIFPAETGLDLRAISTDWYLMVLGQYGAVLVGTW